MAQNVWQSIIGNLTGATPKDPLGDIAHYFRHLDWNPLSGMTSGGGSPTGAAYKDYIPHNAAGESPESYTPTDQVASILANAQPGQGTGSLSDKTLEGNITDKEFEQLQQESSKGNKLAMSLLSAYRPKYGPSPAQFEQQLVQPFVNQLQALPGDVSSLTAQQESLVPSLNSSIAQAQTMAEQNVPGFTPQSPNAQTQGLFNAYNDIASPTAISADMAPMVAGLQDLSNAAAESQKTFPYAGLVNDLLNRYAYQVESPSYSPASANYQGLPPWLRNLFTASTGVQIGGGSTTPNLGLADTTGLSTPALQPVGGTGSTAGG